MGLIHGSAPHAFVLCHLAGSTEVEGFGHPLPSLRELDRPARACRAPRAPGAGRGDRAHTRDLDDEDARAAIAEAERETGLPADDPVRFGAGRLLEALAPNR